MRIYTEVIFEWDEKQNKLVETSSESYDYNGPMALCTDEWQHPEQHVYWGTDGSKYFVKWYYKDTGAWNANKPIRSVKLYKDDVFISRDRTNQTQAQAEAWIATEMEAASGSDQTFSSEADYKTWVDSGSVGKDDSKVANLAKKTTLAGLKSKRGEWEDIVAGDSEFQDAIDTAAGVYERAAGGPEADLGTYDHDDDPNTPEEPILSTLEQAKADAGTLSTRAEADIKRDESRLIDDKADLQEDYDIAIAQGDLDKARLLEDKITSMETAGAALETGLTAQRRAFTPVIQKAEAAMAATGFAGSGAGAMAREALIGAFMEEGAQKQEAFQRERAGIETTFERGEADIDLAGDAALLAQERAVEGLEDLFAEKQTEFERAKEDISTGLGTAAAAAGGAKATYQDVVTTQKGLAKTALETLHSDMESMIGTTRSTEGVAIDWNPFDELPTTYIPAKNLYGWLDPTFDPQMVEDAMAGIPKGVTPEESPPT